MVLLSSSIIIQLLTVAIPSLERLSKQGEDFFSTTIKEIATSESMVSVLSVDEIFSEELVIDDRRYYVSEQKLALSYDSKADLICSLYQFKRGEVIESSRLIRIFNGLTAADRHLQRIYICSTRG